MASPVAGMARKRHPGTTARHFRFAQCGLPSHADCQGERCRRFSRALVVCGERGDHKGRPYIRATNSSCLPCVPRSPNYLGVDSYGFPDDNGTGSQGTNDRSLGHGDRTCGPRGPLVGRNLPTYRNPDDLIRPRNRDTWFVNRPHISRVLPKWVLMRSLILGLLGWILFSPDNIVAQQMHELRESSRILRTL
jgi:hypothetical protein